MQTHQIAFGVVDQRNVAVLADRELGAMNLSAGGHVGLYIGEDAGTYHVLGGNQGDAVSIRRLAKNRLLGARRLYRVGPPANVRRVWLRVSGALSTNEA